jgi:hypothetical protein
LTSPSTRRDCQAERTKPVHEARSCLLTFMKKYVDGAKADIARVREANCARPNLRPEGPRQGHVQELSIRKSGHHTGDRTQPQGGLVDGNLATSKPASVRRTT